ncbi:MAG: type I CRISPR-associated protein Cas7 [Gemmataceae bacterium]
MPVRTGEILFVKCVKCGIPNRDPLRDSDARRLFGEDDGRISLSDVSIKRDVRDYVVARFPEDGPNGPDKTRFVFVQKKYSLDGRTLLGRDGLAQAILEKVREGRPAPAHEVPAEEPPARGRRARRAAAAGPEADDKGDLFGAAFDMRVFGAVFSVEGKSFNQTGPVQFSWAHSLHPVETKYTQGTVCMPSKDAPAPTEETEPREGAAGDEERKGKTQGTIWTQYQLPFAVFAMPAVVNATIAAQTKMTDADMDLVLAGLWKGTIQRQARGRGIQQPLLLLHIEYSDPFFRIGFLEEGLKLAPGRDERERWLGGNSPTGLAEVALNVEGVAERMGQQRGKIARARVWVDPQLRLVGSLPAETGIWPEGV